MSDKIKKTIQFILFLGLGVFFIWFSLKDLNLEQRTSIIENMKAVALDNRWVFLLFSMIIGLFSVVFRALRSVQLLEPLGYKISKINSYHAVMICYLANLAFPRLGEILRCTFIQRYEKVPFQKTLGTVVTERIIDMICFGLVLLFALFLESDKIAMFFTSNIDNASNGLFSLPIILIIIIIFITLIIVYWVVKKHIKEWKIYQKLKNLIVGFWNGLISVVKLKNPFVFILYSVCIWLCYFFMFYIATFAFPTLQALGSSLWIASLTCVVVGTVGFIVAQGGLGAYPLLIASILLLYNVNKEVGLAVGWVIWTTETILYILGGIVSLVLAPFTNPKKKLDEITAEI